MGAKFKDLTGQAFTRLLVVGYGGIQQITKRARESVWHCRCQCGNTLTVPQRYLIGDGTKSCGCLIGQHKRTHGGTGTPTFKAWGAMFARCNNPKHNSYKDYGGRGIRVCERWQRFENFLADMGERPAGKSIDRYPDNNGNYEPGNCRWASAREQSNNRRSSRTLTVNGETRTLAEWERHVGLPAGTVHTRLSYGFTPDEAIRPELKVMRARILKPRPGKHRLTVMKVGDTYRNENPTPSFRKMVTNTGARRGMKFRTRLDGGSVIVTRVG